MATLQTIAAAVVDSFGLLHTSNIRALRDYIKRTPIEMLISELNDVSVPAELRCIWEAGVPKQLQDAYFKRMGGQKV